MRNDRRRPEVAVQDDTEIWGHVVQFRHLAVAKMVPVGGPATRQSEQFAIDVEAIELVVREAAHAMQLSEPTVLLKVPTGQGEQKEFGSGV